MYFKDLAVCLSPRVVKEVEVVAALIVQQGRILIGRRPAGKARAGQWEFPGGKAEGEESPEETLVRELQEELGCRARSSRTFEVVRHEYADLRVTVRFLACSLEGEPTRKEHAELAWVSPEELGAYEFVEADRALLPRIAEAVKAGAL